MKQKTFDPVDLAKQIADTASRLGLNDTQAAEYFGVPVFTYRKWIRGERAPGAAFIRLFQVMGVIEALAPAIHNSFLPAGVGKTTRLRRNLRKLTEEIGHVEKSGLNESTDSIDDSDMSKNPV